MSALVETTAQPHVIDVETLLAPIPGENPAGERLQYTTTLYDEIREARRSDDALEQGVWARETKSAKWDEVQRLAVEALANRTKDLQVAVWLVEALVKRYGLVGLRDGLLFVRGLHENFWDQLYPEIEDGDMEGRANFISWMDRQAALGVKEVALTDSAAGQRYSYLDWERSKEFFIPENLEALEYEEKKRVLELKEQAAEEGKPTSEDWRAAKNGTRRAFYEERAGELDQCRAAVQELERVIDEKFHPYPPGLGALKKSLEEVGEVVYKVVQEKRALEPDAQPLDQQAAPQQQGATSAAQSASALPANGHGSSVLSTGPVRSRQEALQRLAEVADYFRQSEPHSPVSYLVQRAINWGQMPLEIWLKDVLKNDDVLNRVRDTLGLEPPKTDE